jgi:hypothetical protein
MTGVRSPVEAKEFSYSLCVQTTSETHPASYPMGTRGPFLEAKLGWVVTLTTHPYLVPTSRIGRRYIYSLPWHLYGVAGQFPLYFYFNYY